MIAQNTLNGIVTGTPIFSKFKSEKTALAVIIKKFFENHLVFSEAELRNHCISNYRGFTEMEYKKALRIVTNVFRDNC